MATIASNNLNAKVVNSPTHPSQPHKPLPLQVLLGDMGADKSSLILRFVKGHFLEFQESMIGTVFFSQTLAVNDATVKFEIWDTAGQERYHNLAPIYYRGVATAIIIYDITIMESFNLAKKWVQELKKQGNPNMVIGLVGNKAYSDEKRNVTTEVDISMNIHLKTVKLTLNRKNSVTLNHLSVRSNNIC